MCARLMFQAAKHNVYIEPNAQLVYLRHAVLFYMFSESRKRCYFLFYFIYIAQQHVLKTFSSVKIMTRILARLSHMARTVTRMTGVARWLAH